MIKEMGLPRRWRVLHELSQSGADLITGARPVSFDAGKLCYSDADESRQALDVDAVLIAGGALPRRPKRDFALAESTKTYAVRDCESIGLARGTFESAAIVAGQR